jgi:hypothetical protein
MPRTKAQIGMDDKIVSNPELEALLEKREKLKEGQAAYRAVDKEAKEKLLKEPTIPPYRIGRFVISKNIRTPHEVNFTTEAGESISISLADAKE